VFAIPVERITLFIFGGVAQLGAECRTAKAEFWIAVIGPIVSFVVGAVCYGAMQLVSAIPARALFGYLAMINFMLVVFNLIPGFPLDGGRVLRAIIWWITGSLSKGTVIAVRVGQVIALSFILFGMLRALSGELSNGLWIAFVGFFLMKAANSQLQAQSLRDALRKYTVSQVMSRTAGLTVPQGQPAEIIPPDSGLWDALDIMDRNGFTQLLVGIDGHIEGMLTRGDVISFLKSVRTVSV
jgi:hypothetical protein